MRWQFLFLTFIVLTRVEAQTCCSGGVPLSGNIGLPYADNQSLQVSVSYDLNLLRDLKSGTETLNDESRKRTTNTYLLQAGYSFSPRISFEILLPYIIQKREISGQATETRTSGLSDLAFLLKYSFVNNQTWLLQSGAGVKFATGPSDEADGPITLNADLQPGSGANDVLLWSNASYSLSIRRSMSINAVVSTRFTGANSDYLNAFTYEFGNEFSAILGIADQFIIGSSVINPSLALRYRKAQTDRQNDTELPNTGGEWLFLKPGVIYKFLPNQSLTVNTEIPLIADVGGTQLTPTIRVNLGLLFTINFKNEKL